MRARKAAAGMWASHTEAALSSGHAPHPVCAGANRPAPQADTGVRPPRRGRQAHSQSGRSGQAGAPRAVTGANDDHLSEVSVHLPKGSVGEAGHASIAEDVQEAGLTARGASMSRDAGTDAQNPLRWMGKHPAGDDTQPPRPRGRATPVPTTARVHDRNATQQRDRGTAATRSVNAGKATSHGAL